MSGNTYSYYVVDPVTGQRPPSDQYGTPISVGNANVTVPKTVPNSRSGLNEELIRECKDSNCSSNYVENLLKSGADPNCYDFSPFRLKRTPLCYASDNGHIEVVRLLLDAGADVNQSNDQEFTPLYMACYKTNVEIVKLLLEKGANPDAVCVNGHTALHCASEKCNTDIVKLLLGANANANIIDEYGHTPICYVPYNGTTEIAKLLLDAGAIDYYPQNKDTIMKQYFTETETVAGGVMVYTYPLYKKVYYEGDMYIVTLKLPLNAESNIGHCNTIDPISNVKYRASMMYVERIQYTSGKLIKATVYSIHNDNQKGSTYTVGAMVYSDKYDPNPYKTCTNGIHFFMDRESAERYILL